MTDRFDLEQEILECWGITADLKTIAQVAPSTESYEALRTLYEIKFEKLWKTFETMISERQFV